MRRLLLWILNDLHEICSQTRTAAIGFARLIRRSLRLLSWVWHADHTFTGPHAFQLNVLNLSLDNPVGKRSQHVLRDGLRSFWWRHFASWHAMRNSSLRFGSDGTALGVRYARFMADALWSWRRRHYAGKIWDPQCQRCGLTIETTDHFLWSCPLSERHLQVLRCEWDLAATDPGPRSLDLPSCLPRCLRQCGVLPTHLPGINRQQIAALQRYFVVILRVWAESRDGWGLALLSLCGSGGGVPLHFYHATGATCSPATFHHSGEWSKKQCSWCPISALGRILLVAAITPHLKKSDPLYPMLALPDGLVGVLTRTSPCT